MMFILTWLQIAGQVLLILHWQPQDYIKDFKDDLNQLKHKNIYTNSVNYILLKNEYDLEFIHLPFYIYDIYNKKNIGNLVPSDCIYNLTISFKTDEKHGIIDTNGKIIDKDKIKSSNVLKTPHYLSLTKEMISDYISRKAFFKTLAEKQNIKEL